MLANYGDLRDSISHWLHRGDLHVVTADLISLFEAQVNVELRVRQMETSQALPVDGMTAELPEDWLELIGQPRLGGVPLSLVSRDELRRRQRDQSGAPCYSFIGHSVEISGRAHGALMDIDYYARIPALSEKAPSNWLLRDAPAAYLFGSLVLAAPYLNNDGRIETWRQYLQVALDGIQSASDRAEFAGGTLVIGAPR